MLNDGEPANAKNGQPMIIHSFVYLHTHTHTHTHTLTHCLANSSLSNYQVNQLLTDGLTVLQHRGQDAAGIVTSERKRLHLRKDNGLVKDVFQTHHMLELRGNVGIGHCRYPTAGSSSCAEAQPLYTNYPYGICVAHNGNLTNTDELKQYIEKTVGRHVNTDSDSELLLNVFAESLTQETLGKEQKQHDDTGSNGKTSIADDDKRMTEAIFAAMTQVVTKCKGGYAGLYLINGIGLVGFRDPHGIRPLVFGCRRAGGSGLRGGGGGGEDDTVQLVDSFDDEGIPCTPAVMEMADRSLDYVISSESVAIDTLGFKLVRYVSYVILCVCIYICIYIYIYIIGRLFGFSRIL